MPFAAFAESASLNWKLESPDLLNTSLWYTIDDPAEPILTLVRLEHYAKASSSTKVILLGVFMELRLEHFLKIFLGSVLQLLSFIQQSANVEHSVKAPSPMLFSDPGSTTLFSALYRANADVCIAVS